MLIEIFIVFGFVSIIKDYRQGMNPHTMRYHCYLHNKQSSLEENLVKKLLDQPLKNEVILYLENLTEQLQYQLPSVDISNKIVKPSRKAVKFLRLLKNITFVSLAAVGAYAIGAFICFPATIISSILMKLVEDIRVEKQKEI